MAGNWVAADEMVWLWAGAETQERGDGDGGKPRGSVYLSTLPPELPHDLVQKSGPQIKSEFRSSEEHMRIIKTPFHIKRSCEVNCPLGDFGPSDPTATDQPVTTAVMSPGKGAVRGHAPMLALPPQEPGPVLHRWSDQPNNRARPSRNLQSLRPQPRAANNDRFTYAL